jgi:hypothetical protein
VKENEGVVPVIGVKVEKWKGGRLQSLEYVAKRKGLCLFLRVWP